ncbi:MAG: YlxR family protein [Actinobacteria bacterium]|nr:YlxR family protein [Actinomycetota bacterium]
MTPPPPTPDGAPRRTCIGCRRTAPASELRRYALVGDRVVADPLAPGRGAWLCAGGVSCLESARRGRRFQRTLRLPAGRDVVLPDVAAG